MPALLARLMINLAVPVLVYVLLRPHVHSDITALIAGAAVPTACTASVLLWRRRLAGDLLMNTFGIARKIRHVLLDAPGIGS